MTSEHKIIFEEIINEKSPKLKIPEFNVDKKLREVTPPFPSLHSYIVFCGKSRSGKSSLLTSLLTNKDLYKKAYNNVILVIPVHSFTSISEKDNPYLYLSDDKIYHEFNFDVLNEIYEQIMSYAFEGEDTLLIIDDFASSLKDVGTLKLLNMLVNNRRHLKLSIWMSIQNYRVIPLSNRKTINILVLFKITNKAEVRCIWEEMSNLSKEDFQRLLDFVFDKPYQWLLIDRDNNEYHKCFNKISIIET